MAISVADLGVKMYSIGGDIGCAAVQTSRTEHILYDAASCRISDEWNAPPNGFDPNKRVYAGSNKADGTIYYLPYTDDRITSMRLPHNPGACNVFMTANLSGCRFFVDRIHASNDLMVFHANTHQHGSAPDAPANSQSVQAGAILDGQHSRAQRDYLGQNPSIALVEAGALEKADYMRPGELEVMRKRGHGRKNENTVFDPVSNGLKTVETRPSFQGGTTIIGIYNAGWSFYYQTWGMVEYVRPKGVVQVARQVATLHWKSLHNARTKGHRVAAANTDQWVMANNQFYP